LAVDLEKLKSDLTEKIVERYGDKAGPIVHAHGEVALTVDRSILREVCFILRDDPAFQFNFLSYATAVDYSAMRRTPRFEVIYQLYSINRTHRMRIKAGVPDEDPTIDTMVPVWETANWLERECFDMFGIIFKGHPDLRRILMPEDWEGHPLRKEFPLGGVKSFYFKRATNPRAGEPANLVPRVREQMSDI
jgi:NADH-quinone oxidoreductase subunit C